MVDFTQAIISDLETLIIKAATQYYNGLPCELTDQQFDAKIDRLRSIAPEHWLLKSTGWGYKPLGEKCPHIGASAVGSIDVKLKYPEMGSDYVRVAMGMPKVAAQDKGVVAEGTCLAMPKLDGASVVVYFMNNIQDEFKFKALTRGRDNIGVDVTEKVRFILEHTCPDVFKMVRGSYRELFSIRGEIIVPLEHEEAIKATGMKNTRNAASGILNRNEITEDLKYLQFIPYFIRIDSSTRQYATQADMLEEIWRLQFTKLETMKLTLPRPDQLKLIFDKWKTKYPVDGLVLTNISNPSELVHDYTPMESNTLAYKFEGEEAEVVVKDVVWQTGSQGTITPVAEFEPVVLAGAEVRRATLHNYQNAIQLGVGVGARIKVIRSGEVIPYISSVVEAAQKFHYPLECPECVQKTSIVGVHLRCSNDNCGPRAVAAIKRLIEVSGEVEGFAGEMLDDFLDLVTCKNLPDILIALHNNRLLDVLSQIPDNKPHFRKLVTQLCENLTNKYKAGYSLSEFWYICNLTGISKTTAEKLGSIEPLSATMQTFSDKRLPVNVLKSLNDNYDYWKSIAAQLSMLITSAPETLNTGPTFCVTGKLSLGRDEFVKKASQRGFQFHETVKKNTQYLVCNELSGSSKTQKAEKNGTKIVTEEQFWNLT